MGEGVPFDSDLDPRIPGGRVGRVSRKSFAGERLVPVFFGDIDHRDAPHDGGSATLSVTDNYPKIAMIQNKHLKLRDVPDFTGNIAHSADLGHRGSKQSSTPRVLS
jgi:hypothetical protein